LPGDDGTLAVRVETSEILGAETIIHGVLQSGERLTASVRGICRVSAGAPIRFQIDPSDVHVFDEGGDALPRAAAHSAKQQAVVAEKGGV
jgi:multiple sugar transport system ATP-binding protein